MSTVAASQEPEQVAAAPGNSRWAVLAVLCLSLLVTGIDGTIVNVALPTLVRDLGTTASQLQWVVDAYTIIFASLLLIAGNTGDRLGRKGCFIAGLVIFGGGSLACSLVHSAGTLIVMRGCQGLGAAFIMPATLSILTNVFTQPGERARAIAIWAGVSGLGVAIGPLAGGFLLQHFWWGSIFLVNVPIVVLAIVGAVVVVPNSRDENASALDLLGTVLSTAGLLALLYGIIEGPSAGWGQARILVAFVAAVVLLTVFVLWERRTDHPILEVSFFSNPRFTAASIAVTLVFFAMFGSLFFISQFLQFVLGYEPFRSGLALLPVAGVLMVAAPASAKLVSKVGTKLVVTGGLVLVAASLLIFSRTTTTSGYALVAVVLVVIGAGMGLAMAPATDSIMGSLPPEKAGVGSAMNDTTREVGGALGVAIMGSITTALYSSRFAAGPAYAQLHAESARAAEAAKASIGAAVLISTKLPAPAATTVKVLADGAFVHALDVTVLVAAAVALAGAVVAFVFLPARAETDVELGELFEGAAQRLDTTQRRSLAEAT
ncbi:MAG TPA: MFS transporter, partial [Acidimicrobiales bacterium]|nr:MFS transporter [Acidimicrobiales bacterium]